jgi:hypothetical protein
MAVLSDTERQNAWRFLMDRMSGDREPQPLDKAQLRAAIDAADSWIDSNAAAFNLVLPLAVRQSLSARQKAMVLMYVVARRFDIL